MVVKLLNTGKKRKNQKQIIRVFGHTLGIVGKHSLIKI
jgi:hypothetical protein